MNIRGYDAWKLDSGYEDADDRNTEIRNLKARIAQLEATLNECAEYFNDHSDVIDGDYGTPEANAEMRMLSEIEEVLKGHPY